MIRKYPVTEQPLEQAIGASRCIASLDSHENQQTSANGADSLAVNHYLCRTDALQESNHICHPLFRVVPVPRISACFGRNLPVCEFSYIRNQIWLIVQTLIASENNRVRYLNGI